MNHLAIFEINKLNYDEVKIIEPAFPLSPAEYAKVGMVATRNIFF